MTGGWRSTTIQEFVDRGEAQLKTGPFGTQLHASDYVEHGTPVINVRNIGFGTIVPDKLEYISDETVDRLASHLLQAEDIVFGRKGAVERHAFMKSRHDKWFQGSDCLRLRVNGPNLVPRFLSYCFLTDDHKQWMMNQCSHGATMASLNQAIICRIPFRLPPPPIQQGIASILSAYDDLIENNTRRIKIVKAIAQTIFQGALSTCPDLWSNVPIEEVYEELFDGPHATPKPSASGPIYLGIKNVTERGELDLTEIRHIAEEDYSQWTRRVVPRPGDIVFTYEATLNRYAIIKQELSWLPWKANGVDSPGRTAN
jgi:hypothetical protein